MSADGTTIQITFIDAKGGSVVASAAAGASLLEAGQAAGMPLEGTCEGAMACSTCHVIVAQEWFAQLRPASEEEEDMLDLAYGVQPTSRLSCQITVLPELAGLTVAIPAGSHDMSDV